MAYFSLPLSRSVRVVNVHPEIMCMRRREFLYLLAGNAIKLTNGAFKRRVELDNELDGEARCLWIGLVCALIDSFFE